MSEKPEKMDWEDDNYIDPEDELVAEIDKHEAENAVDADGLTAADWREAEEAWQKEMDAIPDYDDEAARDRDDLRREEAHEKSVEDGTFKPWEKPEKPAAQQQKPAFVFEKGEEHER